MKASHFPYICDKPHESLYAQNINLTSLEGCPPFALTNPNTDYYLNLSNNSLLSMDHFPEHITSEVFESILLVNNFLTDIDNENFRNHINEKTFLNLNGNLLTSFENFPRRMGSLSLNNNRITSARNIDQHIDYLKNLCFSMDIINSGYTDVFSIDGLMHVKLYISSATNRNETLAKAGSDIINIFRRWLPTKDLINFQDEMIKAGYESYL